MQEGGNTTCGLRVKEKSLAKPGKLLKTRYPTGYYLLNICVVYTEKMYRGLEFY
jgi:hypothetical protein